jgi:hypothetical protein
LSLVVLPLDYRLTKKGAIALLTTIGDEQHRDFERASSPPPSMAES